MNENVKFGLVIAGAVVVAICLCCVPISCVTIDKGNVGVAAVFGNIHDETLDPGMHFVSPWKTVHRVPIQTRKIEEPATVPTKGGLAVQVKSTLLYHLDPSKAPSMMRTIGEKYEEIFVEPHFKNSVRDATAEFSPEAMYTSDRQAIELKALTNLQKVVEDHGIVIEAVMLLDPILPETVAERIKAKAGAEQDVQRMEFVLKQKELEAKAKVAEAKGIAEAQTIIKQDLDDNYIRYLWVMALKEHSGSIIYVPTGMDGLPFFHQVHPGGQKKQEGK